MLLQIKASKSSKAHSQLFEIFIFRSTRVCNIFADHLTKAVQGNIFVEKDIVEHLLKCRSFCSILIKNWKSLRFLLDDLLHIIVF